MRMRGRVRSTVHPWTKMGNQPSSSRKLPGQKLQFSFLFIRHQRISAPILKPIQDLFQPGRCLGFFLSLEPEVQGRGSRGLRLHPWHHRDRRCDLSNRKEEVGGGESLGGLWGGSIGTDRGPGRWGYSPWNLTTIPVGQTE